jgi:polysaccharide deacetylase 2 family uncharacterized protein YibQ
MIKNKLAFTVTLCVIATIWLILFISKKTDYSYITNQCDLKIADFLARNDINPDKPLVYEQAPVNAFRKKTIFIQKEFDTSYLASLDYLKNSLLNDIDFSPAKISKIKKLKKPDKDIIVLELEFEKMTIYRLILKQKPYKGRIAIVLDDWGYSKDVLNKVMEIDAPLTFAILPGLAYSKTVADYANDKGHEIILHLPLEPHNENVKLEKNTIMTTMDQQEVTDIITKHIASIPVLRGINNHMGSKATEDKDLMSLIFEIAKQNNLYFLDSYTTKKSVLSDVAIEKKLPFLKRDIFLDDENDEQKITDQLIKTSQLAEKKGQVIAIGHARPLTLEVLKKILPQLQLQGYKLVYLSEFLPSKEGN